MSKILTTFLLCWLHFATFQGDRDHRLAYYTFGDSLSSHLGKAALESVVGCDVRPYAVGGSATAQVLDQIAEATPRILAEDQPVAVWLTVGAIDEVFAREVAGKTPDEAAQIAADNVTGIWETLRLIRPDLTVYHVSYPTHWDHGTLLAERLPKEYPGVVHVDVTDTDPFVRLTDGVHPDGLGHMLRAAWALNTGDIPHCWKR